MAARWAARGSEPAGVDEFTVPAEKSRLLEGSRGRIEGLFEVRLAVLGAQGDWRPAIPPPGPPPAAARIWVQLAGGGKAVRSAKEYIKGLCEPELEEKECYPKDMHCIFVGAQSLFLNSLIQDTCADITVLEIGLLSIKGGAEAVVMAQSHVQQLVKLFENNESLLSDNESEIKKQFRQFVEAHADKYTMDLLILPSSLKRELLALTQMECCEVESNIIDLTGSDSSTELLQNKASKVIATNRGGRAGGEEARNNAGTPVTELTKQMDTVFSDAPETSFIPINVVPLLEAVVSKERQSCKRRSSDDEERLPKKQFSLENDQEVKSPSHSNPSDSNVVIDLLLDSCSESDEPSYCLKEGEDINEEMEYKILVNFFRTMGYSQNIVEKVIGILGQSVEPLTLLEEIEKENLKFQKEQEQSSQKPRTINPPLGNNANNSQKLEDKGISSNKSPFKSSHTSKETKNKYHKIRDAPNMQVDEEDKMHMLVCRPASRSSKNSAMCYQQRDIYCPGRNLSSRSSDIETDGGLTFSSVQAGALKDVDFVARGSSDMQRILPKTKTAVQQKSAGPSTVQNSHPGFEDQLGHCSSSQVRSLNQHLSQTSNSENPIPDQVLSSQIHPSNPVRETVGPHRCHPDPSVTGVQRFLESLKKPYRLELKNEPGKPYLKHIIIDGSNVAISHGLRKFFSCRGIAIAVDYFWKRGHRNITVFVPQWRTRRDPYITEQDFLTQLQDVGILSLTPARMVLGARIAAHDDRFLLHLADKTGGVIVTNDNFREFVTESLAWREIIQKRLLQYTFAGDIFMVPDDPLGRNGPRLDDFLRSEGCSSLFRNCW
ncbi:PREDICTED: NEDD4-binding protein 1 isoform X2 [Haliaeetus leucocephalus]|uniref:NEDD4-binding protein 1 isoform X2 n=1 Tax=Haliaeetus leucocephalus TaxID=52644 RepID=UPI00053CB7D6|nr:PREDICTED: NEDD4-binding protein 1 isoform X2 [Haliaeetus leucocephalus]XP_010583332.1 PREDICTED: NEDD4-binding protein 1 isoform X2 [Haliaeetus leucocephalus]